MKNIVVLCACAALFGVLALPAAAGNGNGGNIGSTTNFRTTTYDAAGAAVGATCAYVHETIVPGGFQDKETCTLDPGSALPKTPLSVVGPSPFGWLSDYQLALGNVVFATSWSYKIMPSGVVTIDSFYAA